MGSRAASVGASGSAAWRVLPGATVSISGGAHVGDLVVAAVSYHSITDLPLIGPLVPRPWLHATVTMRTERVSGSVTNAGGARPRANDNERHGSG